MKYLLLLFSFVLVQGFFSQEMKISGFVKDTTGSGEKPLVNALAMLVRIKDSVLVDFKRTNSDGFFVFNLKQIDTFQLVVSHPRFSENSYYLFGNKTNNDIAIKRIILPPKSQTLKEVVIYAYKDPIYYKGDTLVYVADSFQTKPNAVVEDLLKKLPGIKVNANGSIEVQGKEIQQVLVDGDEFFGADPTMATRNLGASGVETVQIYEKKNENSTDDTETIQVLDLKLKEDAKRGYFGKVSGASDFGATNPTPFYEGEFLANKFNSRQKISVFALTSNTMKSSLEWQDMYKYGMSNLQFNEEEDFNFLNWDYEGGEGIPQTLKTGVFYNDNISKKTELNINYTYKNSGLKTLQESHDQYLLTDTTYTSDQQTSGENNNEKHELNFKLTHKLDSLTNLEVETKANFNLSTNESLDNTQFLTEDKLKSRYTEVSNKVAATGSNVNTRLSLRRDFKKKGRKLTFNYRYLYDQNQSEGYLSIADSNFLQANSLKSTDQLKDNNSLNRVHSSGLSFIEPLNKKIKLEVDYEVNHTTINQDKYAKNKIGLSYSAIDSTLSNVFETVKFQNRFGSQLIYEFKKHRLSGGVRFRNVTITNDNFFLNRTINQNINNLLPRARYVYKFSQHHRLVFNYKTASNQPSIDQLQPVQDNSNPNRLFIGNPDLKPDLRHDISCSYNIYKVLSGSYFWTTFNHSVVNNDFSTATYFDQFGRMGTKTVNVNGNNSSSFSASGGFPLFKKWLEVAPSVELAYSKNKGFINEVENFTTDRSIASGLELKTERDSIEFSLAGSLSYSKPTNSLSSVNVIPYSSQQYTARMLWRTPFGIQFESDATYTINSQRTSGYDLNFLIWNASVSKAFLKKENLITSILVYDILNQNISANRYVSSNVITDSKALIIARYFMVRLTYKFNSSNAKEPDDLH